MPMETLTFDQCLADFQWPCLSSIDFITPFLLLLVLFGVGIWSAWRNRRAFRRARRHGLILSLALLCSGGLSLLYFWLFDPASLVGVETSPAAQAIAVVTSISFGSGLFLLFGTGAYALGGVLAKAIWGKSRYRSASQGLVIAIDGPAASGKGTLAKKVAAHFGLPCLDTGLLYRAVARDTAAAGAALENVEAAVAAAKALDATTLEDLKLRGPAAGDAASIVAKIPQVRAALLDYQRRFAATPGGAVLDGRDIGTVVCPDARVKLFITATAEERARRRHLEHQARGETIDYEKVLDDIRSRDARDAGRSVAPLEAANDAIKIDTTSLDVEGAFQATLQAISERLAARR